MELRGNNGEGINVLILDFYDINWIQFPVLAAWSILHWDISKRNLFGKPTGMIILYAVNVNTKLTESHSDSKK